MASGCGKCWKLTGKSNINGYSGTYSTIVLKATNYCPPANPACANGNAHFDIAAPGFDYPNMTIHSTCKDTNPNDQALQTP